MRKDTYSYLFWALIACTFFVLNCSKKDSTPAAPPKSKEAKLLSFELKKATNPLLPQDITGVVDEASKSVAVTLPSNTAVNSLVATFTASAKASVKAGGTNQVSGSTANDFTAPLNYVVTAEDGTQQTYTVAMTVTKSSEAKLLSFVFKKLVNPVLTGDVTATVDEATKKITFTLPPFTPVTNLIASFTASAGASVKVTTIAQQSDVTPNNFTTPVSYTVVAQDGTVQTYAVTATVQPSDEALITSFSFNKANNTGIAKDITGLMTKDNKEIHLRNPYLAKSNFVASFTISQGATLKVNGVSQTSGVTSNSFSGPVTYEVTAQSGKTNTYTVKTTPHILDIGDFLKDCPASDPNINQILSDFQIRIDGNVMSSFPCTEPYYPMTAAQYNDQVKWLQTLRVLFYLDYGQSNHLPWTNLRIYDWLKSKIGGINIVTGLNGGYCCNTFNGKPFINVGALKNNPYGNFAEIPNLYFAWALNNFVLLLHETRHLDGFLHSDCCPAGSARCDNTYDPTNLSPYGMHIWWYNAVLTRQFDFGFDCQSSSFIQDLINDTWNSMNNQKTNFCNTVTIPAKPAYWTDCKYK